MADLTLHRPLPSRRRRHPPRPERRRAGWVAPVLVLLFILLLGAGLGYGAWRSVPLLGQALEKALTMGPQVSLDPRRPALLPLTPVEYLALDSESDQFLQLAFGPLKGTQRDVLVVAGSDGTFRKVGPLYTLPALAFRVEDLPRAGQVLVGQGQLPAVAGVSIRIEQALAIASQGGEPYFRAWRLDPTKGTMAEANYYELIAPIEPPVATVLLVDKYLNVLWYYENGKLVHTFRTATGNHRSGPAPSDRNVALNQLTPSGWYRIVNKVPSSIPYYRLNVKAGDPGNPVHAHWMGFNVYEGDLGLMWGIHATAREDAVGRWASDGSIWLRSEDARVLFDRVKTGTTLVVREGN
jgi:lipoprotein-anchoring transpeptidase ErfK/SrfK